MNTVFFVSKNQDSSSSYEEQTFQALQMLCIFISTLTILLQMSGEGNEKKNPERSEKGKIKRQLSKTQLKEHRQPSGRKAGG